MVGHVHLTLILLAAFIAVASPGPSNLSIMATSMEQGRRAGMTLALGVTTGSLTWGVLAAIGVAGMVAAWPGALYAIKIIGGLYLLFLAWRSARSAMQADMPAPKAGVSGRRTYLRGYLMHLTNPKAIVLFASVFATAVTADTPLWLMIVMVALVMLSALVWYSIVSLFMSSAPVVRSFAGARHRIERFAGVCFVAIGGRILADSRNPLTP